MNAPTALLTRGIAKLCSRCKVKPRAEFQRYCAPCHAAYMREYRERKRAAYQHLEAALKVLTEVRPK